MLDTVPVAAEPQVLPDGFASLPPGAELASVLASVDRSRLAPADVFEVLAARHRQIAHEQAQLLADLFEAGRVSYEDGAGPLDRQPGLDQYSADEAAFTLHWSVQTTAGYQDLAEDLLRRLPKVYTALAAGRIDLPKAWALHTALAFVDDQIATAIVDRLLDRAAGWTVANLKERLRYWIGKLDPAAARTRHQASVAGRHVYARLDADGTAELAGRNLPPDRAAAAFDRIDSLARRAKADGDPRTLPQLRTDTYLDLLAGIAFATRPSCDPLTTAADTAAAEAWANLTAASDTPGPDAGAAGDPPPMPAAVADLDWLAEVGFTDAAGRPFTTTPTPTPLSVHLAPGVDPAFAAAFTAAHVCRCGGLRPPVRGGVHLQVKLSTLMCLDDDPALIPGWGPVIADIARQVAHDQQSRPPWHFDVTDERGNLLHHGHTRRRPTSTEAGFVKARDRTCRAPGCRQPAMICDLDHRQPFAHAGPSHRGGLCTLCAHHHALRHERGFVWHRVHIGSYLVESRTGRHWLVTPDGDLILTAEDRQPGPPPSDLAELFDPADDDEAGASDDEGGG